VFVDVGTSTVLVAVGVSVSPGAAVFVGVGVLVFVGTGVLVDVFVGTGVFVFVGVGVDVFVNVGVGVAAGGSIETPTIAHAVPLAIPVHDIVVEAEPAFVLYAPRIVVSVLFHWEVWPEPGVTVFALLCAAITSSTTSPAALETFAVGCPVEVPVVVPVAPAGAPSGVDWSTPVQDVALQMVLLFVVPLRSRLIVPVPLAGATSFQISTASFAPLVTGVPTAASACGVAEPAPSGSHASVFTVRAVD
jgi:hypothetical protein